MSKIKQESRNSSVNMLFRKPKEGAKEVPVIDNEN